jgi:hypothetical protein
VTRPSDHARRAEIALPAGEVRPLPVAGRAPPQKHLLGPVVPGENHHCVLGDPELVEQVEQRPEVGVELQQAVGPIPLSGLALELLARDHRHVHHRVVEVHVERRLDADRVANERRRPSQELRVTIPPHIEGQLLELGDVGLPAVDLDHPRDRIALGVIERIVRPQRLVVGPRRSVPLGEPLIGRPSSRSLANMPLAVHRALIASVREEIPDRLLPRHQPPSLGRPDRHAVSARPDRVASGHQR